MGNSMGCVRAPPDSELVGEPPLSSKKRLRFRRRRKGRKNRKVDVQDAVEAKPSFQGTLDSPLTLEHSRMLSPVSAYSPTVNLPQAQRSPKLSPGWRGIFCLPGEEDAASAIVDVSSIPGQTAATAVTPGGSATPGGGRLCRVREKVHGVLEKPSVLEEEKAKGERTLPERIQRRQVETMPSSGEHNGVVHIREVDGKLCVVQTVYPSDYGSPAWRAQSDREVEVHKEAPAPFPVAGPILKVHLSEDEGDTQEEAFDQIWMADNMAAAEGLSLHTPSRAQERYSLLESGYASDLPLTSPETAVTTPSRGDWQTLLSASSEEKLDAAAAETALQQRAATTQLPQISEIYVCGESGDLTAKEKLLLWSQQATEAYPGLRCVNFTSSWSDGRMFNALLHRYRPDLINMEAVAQQSNRENLEQAFEIAESLGVTRLLDAEDVDVASPDEKSVITYVSSIYDAFPKIPEGGEGIVAHEVDQRWSEYQSKFLSLLQWSRQQTAIMANRNFPQNPVELKALYNEYVHFKETEIPAKELEKSHVEHLYKLLEVWMEFGRVKLPQGLHPNDLEEEWGKLILEMLEREKVLRPAVDRLELLLQRANKFQNLALDCEEKLTLAKNTLQADMSRAESGETAQCGSELACYLQDCEALTAQMQQELKVLRSEKYYQVEQLAFRLSCLEEELVSLRLQCSSLYRKGHFAGGELLSRRAPVEAPGLSLGQTLLGAAGAALIRRPMARSQLVAMSSSEDEGGLRFIYELLGWVEETQELLEGAEWGADLPSVENNLQEHNSVHTAVEELMSGLQEARSYEAKVSVNFRSNYSETLAKLEQQYCKLLEHSSWRLRSLESLHALVRDCTEELIWLNEREEDEIAFDWSHNNTNMDAKQEMYSELRRELDEKHDVMRSLQETVLRLCQENHPAKQTLEAYSAALQTQWQWVDQLCVCVEQHLKDNTAYFQFMSDARHSETYLKQLQESIKRQYTCDRNSRLSRLEDLLQDSMEEKEQLIEHRGKVASLVGRAKTLVQLRPRCADTPLRAATPVRAVCDYKQIETNVQITIIRGEECVLEDNAQRSKWKVISPTGNEAMVPSVCFTVPPPNQEAIDAAGRTEQLYQQVMSLWHQLHINMKSVVSWHYLLKDLGAVSEWNLDTVRSQTPSERQQVLDHLDSHLSDFLSDSRESSLFTPAERRELEADVQQAQLRCRELLLSMESEEKDESVSRSYMSELQNVTLRLKEAEERLIGAIQTSGRLADDSADNAVRIAEQEEVEHELDALRSNLGDVSRRCVAFLEDKPASSGVPALRSELNRAVEKMDKLHHLSSVFLQKLKMVDVLMRCLEEAESQVRKYESRLSEEDIIPADAAAIQSLRDQLGKWQCELSDQEGVFESLQSDVLRAKEAASHLAAIHPDRNPELERYQERADQAAERWSGVKKQMETRRAELQAIASVLQQYRDGHSELTTWIQETTQRQENTPAGTTDSKALSEELAQQTALVAEIEENQTKLDDCQTHSKQYCTSVKDYELQLMTFRAFVESMHKSPVKRRRMHSSSDAITQEFMDLRTRYTALVTLTTQHVKYISDALRRLEEEEKEVEEEKQARVGQVSDLLAWIGGLQGRSAGPNAESSLAAQQAISEQLAAKKDDVAEAIRSTQVFLLSKQAAKLSPDERAHVEAQLGQLTSTYRDMCEASTQQMQQLEQQLAKEEERKIAPCIAGVLDLGSVETLPVFQAAQRGLIDQDTARFLLEAQVVTTGGLISSDGLIVLSVDASLSEGLIDAHARESLSKLESARLLVESATGGQQLSVRAFASAVESGLICEEAGLCILEILMREEDLTLLTSRSLQAKLESRLQRRELIDPNTAEKVSLSELLRRCVPNDDDSGLLLPVKQQPGGSVCLRSGRKVGIFRAIEEGLIDRQVAKRLLEAQLYAGGIVDPRSGHRLTVHEAISHGLVDQDLACSLLVRQLQNGGILDPVTRERLDLEGAIHLDLLSARMALSVLESLQTFMGMMWPGSGEVLSIAEALEQGVVSGELARNILKQRNAVGALYNPETLQLLPFEEVLEPSAVRVLKDIHLPDVHPNLNRPSLGSSSSSAEPMDAADARQQAEHKLLFHLTTHSYVNAHSGERIVIFDPELPEVVNAIQPERRILKGASVDPATDLRASNLNDAVALLSRDLASEKQKVTPLKIKMDDDISPNITSSESSLGPEVDKPPEPDCSMDLLSHFAANVEKRIQQAIEDAIPQITTLEKILEAKTEDEFEMTVLDGPPIDCRTEHASDKKKEPVKGNDAEWEKTLSFEKEASVAVEKQEPLLEAKESKSKKKKRSKKKARITEEEPKTQQPEIKIPSETSQLEKASFSEDKTVHEDNAESQTQAEVQPQPPQNEETRHVKGATDKTVQPRRDLEVLEDKKVVEEVEKSETTDITRKSDEKYKVGDCCEKVARQAAQCEAPCTRAEQEKKEEQPVEATKSLDVKCPETATLPSDDVCADSGSAALPEPLPVFASQGAEDEMSSEDDVTSTSGKAASLVRQECLEHDQRMVALVSMVRHVEVRLKQQQQQSVGRSLGALDDIIRQAQDLVVELRDLEPEVSVEAKAAQKLSMLHRRDVPPQLIRALEKDQQSLTRTYQTARTLCEDVLQNLQNHRDSYKEAVEAELKSLGGRVEALMSWLRETEVLVNDETDQDGHQLRLSEELQSALASRSGDVAQVALDIQLFVSERAQDLPPRQSRRLLGQLQQLQGAFHNAAGQTRARVAAQRQRDEEEEWRRQQNRSADLEEKPKETEVVQQQKVECSHKLEDLNAWLAGAAAALANQKAEPTVESDDMNVLQVKQEKLKEVQKDLRSRAEDVAEAIRSAEDLLAERRESLSAEEREGLQVALAQMKEQYAALTEAAKASVTEVDASVSAMLQHNTQKAKAFEELQQTQDQIDSLLKDLSAAHGSAAHDVTDLPSSQPDDAVTCHTGALQAELQRLQAQQAQLLQISQSARTLLDQPDSTVPPEEKRRLRATLDRLQAEHQQKLHGCQERLRKSEALKDELAKYLQEHGDLSTWLEQSEQELKCLGEGETDAQELKNRLEEHRKLAEDVICHKADLRFVSISGQKVLDSCQGVLEQQEGAGDAAALEATKQLVTDKLQDANHRYTSLHAKSSELGGRLSGLLERYQQYQDEVVSLHSWLSAQEQNQSIAKSGGDTDPHDLQDTLRQVQLLQDELAERSVQLEKVKRAGRVLVSADESPSLKAVDILCAADGLEKRFSSLSASVSERAEQLQTAVAQSVSVQEGLKALLAWLDTLDLDPAPVEPTAQALQDALTQNQKLRQELLSRQGSVEATRDSVSKLLQSPDASTASGLQGALDELTRRFAAAQVSQAEREAELKRLLPRLESYERLAADLQVFIQSRGKALSPAGQPDRSVDDYRQTVEEVKSELQQEAPQLKSFCDLAEEVSTSQVLGRTQSLLGHVKGVSDDFKQLEDDVNQRLAAILACEQQLLHFRGLSGSVLRWLQAAQEQLPAKEVALDTEALQRRVQQLQELLKEWESQASRVQELNKSGSELEAQVIDITTPQSKAGAPQINGSAPGSVNGIHTCKDLTEIQVAVSDVNARHEALGADLTERLGRQRASLEQRQQARQGAEELQIWLKDKEKNLAQGHAASPSKPEVVRAQAQENKALLSELAEHSARVEELKGTLRKLIADNPDSPEADAWRQQLQEIDARWLAANQTASQRQAELEACADRLGSFTAAASQLGPWLREKELMMSVLGPLSIDPNMLNTQKQQVQFMLREFETRRPQFEQLTQSAEGILSQTQDPKEQEEVRAELDSVSRQWRDLTGKLDQRSEHIDQAQGTSERYQALLRELSASAAALAERLDGQAELSARPEALRQRLQETGEIRSELERRRGELAEAERLCQELSAIVAEPYLKDELKKRLESVSGPLKSLEERAADGLSQLQAALSSTQQFQQMFADVRSWLDEQVELRDSSLDALPCHPEAVRLLLSTAADLQRSVAAQRGSYELIQAEGVSLLAALPAGGDERAALQSRLTHLRQDWEDVNGRLAERENRLKSTLSKAESYQRHKAELAPWLEECEEKEAEIQPSLDTAGLDDALQKARGLALDLERRQPQLEAFNAAADQLLEQCCVGDDEVRDEKAQLNRRLDALSECLLGRTSQLEELSSRLKEFEEGRQAVERRLEAAKHQIEVQEALGPQACSAKSLDRLRSQQENLTCLQPQVVYLRDLAQGLVQDAPQRPEGGAEGTQRLQEQAKHTQSEFDDVSSKLEQCCSALESRLHGVGEVQAHVRDVFSRLADLDDELDSLGPVGRDADSLASQADTLTGFLSRLAGLRGELETHAAECTAMLRREGSSPDLLALRRETEALGRQAGKLGERGQARLVQIQDASERVGDFYRLVGELQGLLGAAEQGLNAQAAVGSEVDVIKQQLGDFKALEREQVDGVQAKLQHVNAVGQGLIQSAAKNTDTRALEHDLDQTNQRWNSLNKRVAERIAQLQEALLHCGKFQDALEPLLSWLSDTEELVANQKPPSAEYRVVKAQIQEQKLLQRLLDDRRPTVEMIRAEGERIAATADAQDREKIQSQLQSLAQRWNDLLDKASSRQRQLEELQVLALHFHEALEPLGEWLSATERRVSSAEPMGTQTAKISQQIVKHKAIQDDVCARESDVAHLRSLSQSLAPLSCASDRDWLGERVEAVRSGHAQLSEWCERRAALLEQALANARLFGEDEVEVLNWLAEVGQRLALVSVQTYQADVLAEQHKHTLSLNEEIVSRKKTVDQAVKNGQALLKQTTGEEVLLIQEKLDGIKSRYAEMTAGSSKALRTLEQALQLATRFASAHHDLNQWLDAVEAELNDVEPDASPAYQERQKELKKVSAEKRLVLDTLNEVGSALLDLVPWRAREGLDRLVADANQRYRQADDTITQRVQLVQAAIQRSQQYEEAVDAELAWLGETERKLASLGPLSLEPDVTVAQLQVQKAFNIDIIRHKDTVDQLLATRDDILETCSDAQKDALMVKTDSLSARYDAVNQNHSERFAALEQAQVLVTRFWETYEELEPWLGETESLIGQLPPPAIDTDALRLQQDQMRLLRESIAEHKPHMDKLLKIGPPLAELSASEGPRVTQCYTDAERRYSAIKDEVKGRAGLLDEAVSQSAQFHDKMDPLLETLEAAVQRLRQPPPVAAEVDKIREQLADHRAQGLELDKLLPSFSALCARGEELIGRAAHDDPAAQAVHSRLLRLRSLWDEIRQRAEDRESKLNDVLDLAGKFWADVSALLSTLRDSQDIVKELEDPGVDPSLIKQQIEAAEAIKAETDGLREELEFVRTLGADLIFACGETEKPEVKKTIDEMNGAWESLNRTWRERMERLDEAMSASVQYQDALQSMFDYLDNAVIKLCEMSTVGTDLGTVKHQIEELKQYKVDVYQQQIDMEKLCHQGELLLKKVSDQTDRDMIQEPLTELRHLWENLGDKITQRQHKLEAALLALGQFQHALSELQAWLTHTYTTLDTQRPISSDPKAIEIELAKHHVLRNDVLSHHATVDAVNAAAAELLESSPGDEASHLREQLDKLNHSWQNLLLKTQERQKLLEAALHQAEGFHGELEEFLQWMRRTESQLSAAKPTGGLPETAREQLEQHMELQSQLSQRADQYHRLLDAGESMLLARGEDAGPGTTQTQQNLAMLQNKWAILNTKMDDRRAKLEEALSLATSFQTSLQDTINWLTQAEQTLNMAQPPSLLLDTVLFQIDEHKVFVNEVNTHREQVLALEKSGSQLRFASLKQDVVLIKNLLLSVQARWDKLVQRSLDRGRHLDEARKRAKQFHEAWRKLSDWLEEAENRLDSELEIPNEPDRIKVQLTKHKEFQKALGSKQPVYDTTVRSGRAMRDKAQLPEDTQKLDLLVGEVRDKWDTVCGKSVERQHKLEEALLFSGQFAEALQALVDWLYRVEPQLAEDLPVHGDLDLVSNLMDSHKAFQKEMGKRTGSVQALKRSARDLMETGRDDTAWVKVQLQELSNRWETVCALSVTKQTRLQQALKQAEEFRTAVQMLLEWLSEAEQSLRFRGVLPEEAETLQALLHTHRQFLGTVEEKRAEVNRAAGMGEAILALCHADSITTIKHWITIIRARFEEVLTWAKQHEQRLEAALTEVLNNANLLEELLSWLQWAETTLVQRDLDPLPQDIPQVKGLITEHQMFMEEMTRKQPDVDKVTKSYKRKPAEPPSSLAERRGGRRQQQQQQHQQPASMQVSGTNPRLNHLCARWQQVWLLALDRQRKLNDALDRLEELKEFANFDFDVWRKKYMRWMNHKKSRVMDFFRRIDKDQDGKITRQEFIDGILASKFPTSKLEMTAVADIFDRDGDGYIDYYEFVAALHPNKDAYRPTTDADKIEDEVTRQVAQCKCAKRFQVEQIGENKYRFFLGNQFGDSQQLRLVRILRSTVMVRVGGGWMALDEFLVKNDPCRVQHPGLKILRSDSSSSISSRIVAVTPGYFCCRARGRTNLELREKFILPEGTPQSVCVLRSRGRRSKPGSRNASPTRSSSSASHSGASAPSTPATPTASASSRGASSGSKLKRPTFHSSRGSLTGENGGTAHAAKRSDPKRAGSSASGPASRAGSRAGSRASSRRGSDASDASELQDSRSVCSDASDTPRRPGAGAKPSKIPTITKKTPSPKAPGSSKK
ncbi:microtubule-actin cross-linking factor 1 isoform X7 [Syngnathus typhle]|uniref:microtubule-actin cross-linking factor 1 isoform X7 n=1 Tax=Syngnathus typhle TaxID=161592 RepID=UPI002A6B1F8B|nr:microtubule-actin cross-linking factor 1 isoform X7 [Syngnathus typhle]